jgi:iron complex outermembrane recepter protein
VSIFLPPVYRTIASTSIAKQINQYEMNSKKISMLIAMVMVLVATGIAQQPAGNIRGKIITADNKPAEGVTILVKNTAKNAIADNNGAFEIKNVLPGNYTLLVSLIGYKDAEQEITVENGKGPTVSLQLTLSNKELNEVVVTANKNSFKTNRVSGSLRLQSPILEIPQNIQVVTAKLINNQQIFICWKV